jgi:hypothetical protein
MSEIRILISCYGSIFHGTGNSAQLCQNFGTPLGIIVLFCVRKPGSTGNRWSPETGPDRGFVDIPCCLHNSTDPTKKPSHGLYTQIHVGLVLRLFALTTLAIIRNFLISAFSLCLSHPLAGCVLLRSPIRIPLFRVGISFSIYAHLFRNRTKA